jgi:hypothetical protein
MVNGSPRLLPNPSRSRYRLFRSAKFGMRDRLDALGKTLISNSTGRNFE